MDVTSPFTRPARPGLATVSLHYVAVYWRSKTESWKLKVQKRSVEAVPGKLTWLMMVWGAYWLLVAIDSRQKGVCDSLACSCMSTSSVIDGIFSISPLRRRWDSTRFDLAAWVWVGLTAEMHARTRLGIDLSRIALPQPVGRWRISRSHHQILLELTKSGSGW